MNISIPEIIKKYETSHLEVEEANYVLSLTQCNDLEKGIKVLKEICDASTSYKMSTTVNVENAWRKFDDKVFNKQKNIYLSEKKSPIAMLVMASLVLIGISLALYFNFSNNFDSVKFISQGVAPREVSLADKSLVMLNKSSSIEVMGDYNQKLRKLKLNGEGFFKVTPDKNKPFVVEINLGRVVVLGTAFNVLSNDNADSVVVSVKTGKVKFVPSDSDKEFIILPSEKFVFFKTEKTVQFYKKINKNADSWYSKNLEFESTDLKDVLDQISKIYNIKYSFEYPESGFCRFTGMFENYSISRIHEILETTMGVKFETIDQTSYQVKGKICQ